MTQTSQHTTSIAPTRASGTGLKQRRALLATLALLGGAALWHAMPVRAAEAAVVLPASVDDIAATGAPATDTAVFAGGCFWGVQAVFQHVKGVSNALSGYVGGTASTATYDIVGEGKSGHAEAVRISYDPKQVSYGKLLQIYFSVAHNPTELNRQGPDVGTQYRSTVFPVNAAQARVAKNYIAQLDNAKKFGQPIVTTIEMQKNFYPAEAYHQDFLARNPDHPYIVINDLPKVDNLKRLFPSTYRAKPVLVGAGA